MTQRPMADDGYPHDRFTNYLGRLTGRIDPPWREGIIAGIQGRPPTGYFASIYGTIYRVSRRHIVSTTYADMPRRHKYEAAEILTAHCLTGHVAGTEGPTCYLVRRIDVSHWQGESNVESIDGPYATVAEARAAIEAGATVAE